MFMAKETRSSVHRFAFAILVTLISLTAAGCGGDAVDTANPRRGRIQP